MKLLKGCTVLVIVALVVGGVAVFLLTLSNRQVGVANAPESSRFLSEAPPRLSESVELKVVTFNIQNLPFSGDDYAEERMRAIGAKLMVLDPDIVAFQEAFVDANRETLLEELSHTRLKHHQCYPSGRVGSGLLIASAFPIEEAYFHRFTESNAWYMLHEGDYWAGKGAALARLRLPDDSLLDCYNTHAQADYGKAAYTEIRRGQLAEFAAFIEASQLATAPALILGDLNVRRTEPGYQQLVESAGLTRLMTIDSRIDHILARQDPAYTYTVIDTQPIEEFVKIGDMEFQLSDHQGFMSVVRIAPAEVPGQEEEE